MKLRIPIEATNVFWEVAKRALGSGLKMNEMSVVVGDGHYLYRLSLVCLVGDEPNLQAIMFQSLTFRGVNPKQPG